MDLELSKHDRTLKFQKYMKPVLSIKINDFVSFGNILNSEISGSIFTENVFYFIHLINTRVNSYCVDLAKNVIIKKSLYIFLSYNRLKFYVLMT